MVSTTLHPATEDFLLLVGLPTETSRSYMHFNQKLYQLHIENISNFVGIKRPDFAKHYIIGSLEHGSIYINAN